MEIRHKKQGQSKIRPLIKWTGGKYDEFKMFSAYIPDFKNYYEPFFGGGGVFFALQPQQKCFINDKSADLIKFYAQLTNPAFKKEMSVYVQAWESAGLLAQHFIQLLTEQFSLFIGDKITVAEQKKIIQQSFDALNVQQYKPLFTKAFCLDVSLFKKELAASVADKMMRIKRICQKEEKIFTPPELQDHIATGIKSGLYLYIRKMMNDAAKIPFLLPIEKEVANWFFVREFCYASMFRYNAQGGFNIPYGGIAYNGKNFGQKVKGLFNTDLQNLFAHTIAVNADFETFFAKHKPTTKDFIFLDPPYDSKFSAYDNNSFTKDDQVRLRNVLKPMTCKWMMVIKETVFIRDLYEEINASIIYFDKKYMYNVRGRNNRDTKHLIITNYDTATVSFDKNIR